MAPWKSFSGAVIIAIEDTNGLQTSLETTNELNETIEHTPPRELQTSNTEKEKGIHTKILCF